jgi:glycosyltransferase involved in cell wall biosynthesis
MKTVLFIHQNFPGQFRSIGLHLAKNKDYRVLAIGREGAGGLPGVEMLRYKLHRNASSTTHHYLQSYENGVLHGQAVLRLLIDLKKRGYRPDVIIGHPGWGETLYVKEVFPHARLIHFCEYYYHARGADADFDPEFPLDINGAARIRTRNAMHLLNLEQCDLGVTPTHWQHSLHPAAYRNKIEIVHEGIDTANLKPEPNATLALPNGRMVRAGCPVVTFVARNLEPYRGFHQFMRALPAILKGHPGCEVIVVGGDDVSYGIKPADAPNWRSKMLMENPVDQGRVHFLGKVPYDIFKKVLQVSAAHVYLTYPFVLSWSVLEAMASGCLVIGSKTAPVEEVITHGENGFLVDFHDSAKLSDTVLAVLHRQVNTDAMRVAARQHVIATYNITAGVRRYERLINWNMSTPDGLVEYALTPTSQNMFA